MNSRFTYGILSLVLAALIAFVAIPTVAAQANGTTEIVRVKQPIMKGELIESTDVETVEVGAHNLPENIARHLDDVVGRYATTELLVGDYILSSKVSVVQPTSDVQLSSIPSGKVAISVSVKTLASGLSDKLQTDDIVRFYYFLDEAVEVPELQFVRVLSVTDSKGMNVDNSISSSRDVDETDRQQTATITVLASPLQAQVLTGMENNGALHVALVSRGDADLADELLSRQDEIFASSQTTTDPENDASQTPDTGSAPTP